MAGVGNLGGYQVITTLIKKLGGPKRAGFALVAAFVGTNAATGILSYRAGKANGEAGPSVPSTLGAGAEPSCPANGSEHVVSRAATSNDGTTFSPGERLRVMDSDGDAVMVERIGDEGSPYWVSRGFLESIAGGAPGPVDPE